ncbi:hypothetical protein BDP27DRAFT_1230431 [Rhodocollybia butyracea]|uniref:Uncharacterized protein n=1 Tax=Rhodocollybia butyracea TaxID=206335 RepID=A0A9P5U2A9_9AGAR|nr:hypothetical protein BDP27DRAFT_1230431 [Rhodocollybia butyracea]
MFLHRVTIPRPDHQHLDRLGLLYFSRPHNDVHLATIKDLPVLQCEGLTQLNEFEASGNPVPTMKEWTFAKQKWQWTKGYHDPKLKTAVILPGFTEKPYA